jgi:hypothetical protein
MLAHLILTIAAFALSCFGPGFFLVRKTRWSVEEKTAASIALSLLFLYLASFLVFALGLPAALHDGILVLCTLLTFACGQDLLRFLRSREARSLLAWFGIVCLWSLALMALIRNYSGATWYLDWFEHFRRSLFFLGGQPYDIVFEMNYTLPARPPLMNVLCAHFLALAGREYPVYQLASTLLSVLVYFPIFLLARWFAPQSRSLPLVVAGFLILNPMFVQNATYSWTKLLAAFYVLTGVHFYLTGWKTGESPRMIAAFASLSAAILTHYSAGPYAVCLGLHYLAVLFKRRERRWAELASILLCSSLLLATWFGWSLWTYGARSTVEATSTVRDTAKLSIAENVTKVATNVWNTFVPHLLRDVGGGYPDASALWGIVRDESFKLYQSNLLFGFGAVGWVLLLASLYRRRGVGPAPDRAERRFWLWFVAFTIPVGIAVHGQEDRFGLAHICLQPLILVGLAFLAGRFGGWTRPIRLLALLGMSCDAAIGILLHLRLESIPFPAAPLRPEGWQVGRRDLLIGSPQMNWTLKTKEGLVYVGDLLSDYQGALWVSIALLLSVVLYRLAREAIGKGEGKPRS